MVYVKGVNKAGLKMSGSQKALTGYCYMPVCFSIINHFHHFLWTRNKALGTTLPHTIKIDYPFFFFFF